MIRSQEFKDRDGNHLVTVERRIERDSTRFEISAMAIERLRDGDAFLFCLDRNGNLQMEVIDRYKVYR